MTPAQYEAERHAIVNALDEFHPINNGLSIPQAVRLAMSSLRSQATAGETIETIKEENRQLKSVLHQIQMYVDVAPNPAKLGNLIQKICAWSYAHRAGNGELTEEEQDERIARAFRRLTSID